MKNKQSKKDQETVDRGKAVLDDMSNAVVNESEVSQMTFWDKYRKLILGILMFSVTTYFLILFCENNNMFRFEHMCTDFFNSIISGSAGLMTPVVCVIVAFSMVRFWITGCYYMATWRFVNPVFENDNTKTSLLWQVITTKWEASGSTTSTDLANIDSLIAYRDAKLGNMTYPQRADLLARTSILDAARAGVLSGNNAQKTIAYMNSVVGNKRPEDALKFVSGGK